MKKINIVFFIYDLGLGGAEIQVILHAIELHKMGNSVTIVFFSDRRTGAKSRFEQKDLDGIKFINLSCKSFSLPVKEFFVLLSLVKAPNTVIHSHMWKANLMTRVFRLFCSEPIINSIHAVKEGHFVIPILYRISKNRATLITTVSNHAKSLLTSQKIASKQKIKVFDNILDPKFHNIKTSFNKRKKDFNIVFVGRLVKEKNIINLIKAFELVVREYRQVTLHIVGDGYLRETIKQKSVRSDFKIIFACMAQHLRLKIIELLTC